MITYYDPVYGQVDLENVVLDIVKNCQELMRLKYIGMMNFKSIVMLPLTTITRLEHTIGLTYLTQIFSYANNLRSDQRKELLIAALYHDINCGAFGHSVEWAINRYTPYNHESESEWMKIKETRQYFNKLPRFIEMPGLHKYKFEDDFSPNLQFIHKVIQGVDNFIINNNGIDLDNIDSVFRMAFYLGIGPKDRDIPVKLVNSLRVRKNIDNFITSPESLEYIDVWSSLRSSIYQRFIYSKEYMGFEFLVFCLINEYIKNINEEDIRNLFHFTDEKLLWTMYDNKKEPEVSTIAKKLLTHDLPVAYSIIRSENFDKIESLLKNDKIETIKKGVKDHLLKGKLIPDNLEFYFHVTTDDRKTCRNVEIYVEEKGQITKKYFGNDRKYIVIGILGNKKLPPQLYSKITNVVIEILAQENLGRYEITPFSGNMLSNQESLF